MKPNKPNAIIFDLDGTLSNCTHRMHFVEKSTKDFDSFYSAMEEDTLVEPVRDMLMIYYSSNYRVIILTGRPECYREITETWLKKYEIPFFKLYMRPNNKKSTPDMIYKERTIAEISKSFVIKAAVEDRDRVVKMWRDNGIFCFQVKSILAYMFYFCIFLQSQGLIC